MTLNLMLRNHLVSSFVVNQPVMSEVLHLGKRRIEWVSSVKHLGNYVNSDMTDKTDRNMTSSSFIGYVIIIKNKNKKTPCLLKTFA